MIEFDDIPQGWISGYTTPPTHCGHDPRYVVGSDEGTCFCALCELQAANEQIRELEEEIEVLKSNQCEKPLILDIEKMQHAKVVKSVELYDRRDKIVLVGVDSPNDILALSASAIEVYKDET